MTRLDCCIDVSHNNGPINWSAVDPSILLVFAKASQGSGFIDPQFRANKAGCLATGRMFIPYHFLDASDIDAQGDHFWNFCEVGQPFALDWEGRASTTAAADDVESMGSWLQDEFGRIPVGYWGQDGSAPGPVTGKMYGWTRWIPRYRITGVGNFTELERSGFGNLVGAPFWQYTAWGSVFGIKGFVDRSVWSGDADSLRAWYKGAST